MAKRILEKYQIWIDARKRFNLSNAHIQMARELGMNPKSLGKLANHKQEPWKAPLPDFIERIYLKRFEKERPDQVKSIEECAADEEEKKAARRTAKALLKNRIETDLARIKSLGEKRNDENWEFRAFLKSECDSEKLDPLMHRLYGEVSAAINCMTCANCCRQIAPVLDEDDIKRFAEGLGTPVNEFAGEYLEKSDGEGSTFRSVPCPFRNDKLCSNYDVRPSDCRSYPHLHKEDAMGRLIGVVMNYSICPIVFNVYERLKEQLWQGKLARYRHEIEGRRR